MLSFPSTMDHTHVYAAPTAGAMVDSTLNPTAKASTKT